MLLELCHFEAKSLEPVRFQVFKSKVQVQVIEFADFIADVLGSFDLLEQTVADLTSDDFENLGFESWLLVEQRRAV